MAGALSLEQDILALVEKHRGVALPEHLLARLAEESRLLAVREQIRSLHEADPFGLFSDSTSSSGDTAPEEEEEDGDKKDGHADVLPENVDRMLQMMKITRLDKVTALSGFTTIDAEVEFSREGSKGSSRPTDEEEEESEDEEEEGGGRRGPVHLAFRFRREPLLKNAGDSNNDHRSESVLERGGDQRVDGDVEVIDVDGEVESKGVADAKAAPGSGAPSERENGHVGGCEGLLEGRKRVCSQAGESDEGRGDKGRKRPKGRGEVEEDADEEEEEEEEDGVNGEGVTCTKEACESGCCDDGSESDDESLGFDPRTLVSYTISGGIGFEPPEVLLQAVVYARGDGPACVMPPTEGEDDDEASLFNDQEDVFDCNVDGPALASVGRALGLHTEPSTPSDSEQESADDSDDDDSDGEKGGMTMSDLVWWIMLFPFFEREFDMVEVVASSVFGEEDDSDSDDGEGDSEEVLGDGSGSSMSDGEGSMEG